MRFTNLTIAISSSLAFVLLTFAAPAPPQVDPGHNDCVESCLETEASCLLDRNPMLDCFDAYDGCFDACFPELSTDSKMSSNTNKHTDVTFEDKDTPPTTTENEEDKSQGERVNMQQEEEKEEVEEEDDDDFVEIPAPPGGEDDEEYEDDPSDY